jgi:hypothetical protein
MPHAHFCAVFMGRPNKFPAVFRLLFVCLWLALMLQGIGNANETLSCYPTSSDDVSTDIQANYLPDPALTT